MKILVTGTAGFIGFHLAKKLLERGDEVVGIDNINDYYDVNLKYGRLAELGIYMPKGTAKACTSEEHISDMQALAASSTSEKASDMQASASEKASDMQASAASSDVKEAQGTAKACTSEEHISDMQASASEKASDVQALAAPTLSTKYPKHKFYKIDLSDREAMENLFQTEQFDAVMNLAAQAGVRYSIENPHSYVQSNVVGFLNILEGCRNTGVKNLAFASSSSVYGLNESQPFKTTDPTEHQVSLYAATKKSNEMMAHTYAHLYGIHVTGLRFFTVYGPWGRPDMAPMLFTDAILGDRAIKVFNNGEMSRDFTYIDDIVDGIIKVIDNPAQALSRHPEITDQVRNDEICHPELDSGSHNLPIDRSTAPYRLYNIGNNAPLPLMTFIETIENALGKKAEKIFMPMQDGDVVSTYADVSGLINDFGYKPDTDLKDGIAAFVKWYREFYGAKD